MEDWKSINRSRRAKNIIKKTKGEEIELTSKERKEISDEILEEGFRRKNYY